MTGSKPIPYRLTSSSGFFDALVLECDGVFYVGFGHHQSAMSLLLAFAHGVRDGIDVGRLLSLEFPSETADHWLEITLGSAFRSAVSSKVYAWRPENLTVIEKRFLGPIEFLGSK